MKKTLVYIFVFISSYWFAQTDSSANVIALPDSIAKTVAPPDSMLGSAHLHDSLLKPKREILERLSIEFNPGFSLPFGNFSSGDYTNPLAGYAKEGYSLGANMSIKITEDINVMLCYTRQLNTFDETSFSVNALKGTKNYTLQTNSNWKNHFVLAGASANIPLDESNYLTPRLLVGVCLGRTPSYETFPISVGSSTVLPTVVESEADVSLAARIGIGLRKNLSKQFFLSINPDFYFTSLKVNLNKSFATPSSSQAVSIVSLSISLGFRIFD